MGLLVLSVQHLAVPHTLRCHCKRLGVSGLSEEVKLKVGIDRSSSRPRPLALPVEVTDFTHPHDAPVDGYFNSPVPVIIVAKEPSC